MIENCMNCKFYRVEDSESHRQGLGRDTATCMRFPPQYTPSGEYSESPDSPVMWYQPTVIWDGWCGEFKATREGA